MSTPSRREVLTAAAVTATLPLISNVLGGASCACAAAPAATSTAPATATRGRANRVAPDEPAGWFATKIKPADVKDGEFTDVPGHVIVLVRTGKDISALTTKCTHQGCKIPPTAGAKILTCPCHGAQFNLDGTVAKAPARTPLVAYAIRVSDAGVIEIDPGQKPAKDAKEFKITVA
jgi:Rieske Fe-S protein